MITEKFSKALDGYLNACYKISGDIYDFTWREGQKNVKVIMTPKLGSGSSVHSFIDKETGAVYKPASWAAPAKHARGNIFNGDHGAEALTRYGIVYLK